MSGLIKVLNPPHVTLIDDINTFKGVCIGDLVVYELGGDPVNDDGVMVLYGFDEVGMFDGDFTKPAYAIIRGFE